ncbi:MAG: hypothetical protein ACRYFL_01330 [Janthinobacterium lividum]
MKFRLTPLNLATAGFIVLAADIWINGAKLAGGQYQHFGSVISWMFLLFAFAVAFLDITFRNLFPEIKKLWIIELSLMVLTAVMYLLVS